MEATCVDEEEGLLSLDNLPSEVLLHILSFVGVGRSNEASRSLTDKSMRSGLLSCLLVNKRMYGLANDDMLWKSCCHRPSIGWITSKKVTKFKDFNRLSIKILSRNSKPGKIGSPEFTHLPTSTID